MWLTKVGAVVTLDKGNDDDTTKAAGEIDFVEISSLLPVRAFRADSPFDDDEETKVDDEVDEEEVPSDPTPLVYWLLNNSSLRVKL